MRRLFLVAFILAITSGLPLLANDLPPVELRDSLGGDDTTAIYRYDTVYTEEFRVDGFRYLSFYTAVKDIDTNLVNDTLIVTFQHSYDGSAWSNLPIDTFAVAAADIAAVSTVIIDADATAFGGYGRFMIEQRDSLEAIANIQGNVYTKDIYLYYEPRGGRGRQ